MAFSAWLAIYLRVRGWGGEAFGSELAADRATPFDGTPRFVLVSPDFFPPSLYRLVWRS